MLRRSIPTTVPNGDSGSKIDITKRHTNVFAMSLFDKHAAYLYNAISCCMLGMLNIDHRMSGTTELPV